MTVTSVIIPVRNGERFIAQALVSVTPQLQSSDEILVVDDGCTDNTRAVAESIKDPRIRILSGRARGVSSARNIGIDHAKGEFICFLDHDDLWPAERHEVLLQFLQEQSNYDAVYGRIHVISEADAPAFPHSDALDGKYLYSHVATGLYRRSLIAQVGYFDEDMHFGEDTDFSLRLLEIGMRHSRADIVSLLYRRHAGNTSNNIPKNREGIADTIIRKIRRSQKPDASR